MGSLECLLSNLLSQVNGKKPWPGGRYTETVNFSYWFSGILGIMKSIQHLLFILPA